jgi:hypothetical protein
LRGQLECDRSFRQQWLLMPQLLDSACPTAGLLKQPAAAA